MNSMFWFALNIMIIIIELINIKVANIYDVFSDFLVYNVSLLIIVIVLHIGSRTHLVTGTLFS